jgi:hypothetical protein
MKTTKQHYLHAIKVAILREEKEFEGIPLPSPQKTGTGFQRQTYAKQQAEKFYAKHFEQPKKIVVPNDKFMETVCELAGKVVSAKFGGSESEDDGDGGTKYTEDAQDFFNEVYDEFEYLLNNTLNVWSDTDLN